jgi:hypothetical protein
MKALPDTPHALVLRTDFSDEPAWQSLRAAFDVPSPGDGFLPNLTCFEDRSFEAATVAELIAAAAGGSQYRTFMFVADGVTMHDADHPVLVIDLADQAGRSFRVIPSEMWSVENNLSLANLDFEHFSDSVDAAGVFRGFE